MRNHVRVQYKPARYHQGGECVVVRRDPRAIGRDFRAYVGDDLMAVSRYVEHRIAQGVHWSQV